MRVPRLIGAHRMADMMLTGRVLDAEEGHALGLSHYLTGPGEGLARALELAQKIAGNSPVTNFAVLQALPAHRRGQPDRGLPAGVARRRARGQQPAGAGAHADVPLRAAAARSSDDRARRPRAAATRARAGRRSEIARFLDWLDRSADLRFADYDDLHAWSVDRPRGLLVGRLPSSTRCGSRQPPERVLGRREMPGAEWFPGATLNYAEHAVGGPDARGSP